MLRGVRGAKDWSLRGMAQQKRFMTNIPKQMDAFVWQRYSVDTRHGECMCVSCQVDCTQDTDLCRKHQITGFPSIRVYRKGHDDVYIQNHHVHESYLGDRTKEALIAFADSLIPSAGNPHMHHPETQKMAQHAGCNLAGHCPSWPSLYGTKSEI